MATTVVSLEAVTNIEKHLELESDLDGGSEYDKLYFSKLNLLKQNLKPDASEEDTVDGTVEDSTDDEGTDDSLDDSGDVDSLGSDDSESTDTESDKVEDGTEEEPASDTEGASESVAKECIRELHTTSRLREIENKLLPGFSLEDVSEMQFNKEMVDDLSYLTECTEKISQIMTEYIKGRFTTYNQYLDKTLRARQVVSLNEKIKKVEVVKSEGNEVDVDDKVIESQAELEVGMDVSVKSTYKNELFVSQLKIGTSLDFDKNIKVASNFLRVAITNYSVSLNSSIKKIRNNIASSSDKVETLVLPVPDFDGLEKKELKGYESPTGLGSYVYKEILPGDMVFITYNAGKDSKSKLASLEGCKSIFGVYTLELAKVRFSPLLEDKDRLISYLDEVEALVRFGKHALKYIYELSTNKLAELSRAFVEFKKLYNSRYGQSTVKDSQMLRLVSHSDYIGRYTILTLLLLHDYLSRIVEASLDFIKESLIEQD